MTYLTTDQKRAAFEYLITHGWHFDTDRSNPRGDWRGWWIHPEHPVKNHRTGDAQPVYIAAESAFNYFTNATLHDLPSLCPYRNEWIWPETA